MTNVLLSPKQQLAIDVLLASGDRARAAQAAGVNERTLRKWMHEPAFLSALQTSQDATLDRVTADLVQAAGGAVALLVAFVYDEEVAPSLRLQASRALLDTTLRWHELRGIERRIEALEQALNEAPITIEAPRGNGTAPAHRTATGRA